MLKNQSWETLARALRLDSGASQSYDTLLSSLLHRNRSQPPKSLLVSSAQSGEGKTTISVNLALTMAMSGANILLVDADLRQPELHEVFELANDKGLRDYLSGRLDLEEVTQTVELDDDGPTASLLKVMPCGQAVDSISKLLTVSDLSTRIEALVAAFDMVVFDSSPVLAVSDPCYLAPYVDGTILVLNTGVTTATDVGLAKDRLVEAGGRPLGFVMNNYALSAGADESSRRYSLP